jgi:glycosyltransferase involved in cell wall biosynthesis
MKISIIIPTLNEVNHIKNLVNSIFTGDIIEKEVFILDGGSTDGTREKVLQLATDYPHLTLLDNPQKYVSHGFNKAFQLAKGEYISLVGAHAVYPQDYFTQCIHEIEAGNCDAAGGFLLQKGSLPMGQAIALAMSSKMGVGNTEFRTERKKMYVDSVAFAVYKRSVFEKVGLLDEELIRNQDDELHYRMNAAGLRILMLPDLEVVYFVRNSLSMLYKQYFQYGLYKPLVIKKVKEGLRLRHLIPAFFVSYLLFLPISFLNQLYLIPLFLYIILSFVVTLGFKEKFSIKLKSLFVFPVLHIAYGSGFIIGLKKLW